MARSCVRALILLAVTLAFAPNAQAAPKYYFALRTFEGADEVGRERVRKLFLEEAARHPEILPERADLPSEPQALGAKLTAMRVKGYWVTVRLRNVTRETKERPGRRPLLERGVKVMLFGSTIPGEVAAFSGDGEARAGVEVLRGQVSEAEAADVLADALKEAMTGAVESAIARLGQPSPPPTGTPRKKRK